LLEAGIALGGSAIIMATLMADKRIFHGYDVFEMIPPPTEEDDLKSQARYDTIKNGKSQGLGGNQYYGYIDDLYTQVVNNFQRFGLKVDEQKICLHQGLFQNTMAFNHQDRVALAHIDCDWYQPVKFCLETIYQVLSPQGYIILDDYHDYGGCKKAVHEFLATRNDLTIVVAEGNLVLMRESS
jgi:O-methyltransferase